MENYEPFMAIIEVENNALVPVSYQSQDCNPATVYLASLTSPQSKRTMTTALNLIASLLTGDVCDGFDCPWHLLRAQHTKAIRARLAERHSAASVNQRLAALRGVLNAAFELGLMNAEDLTRALKFKSVKGERLLSGRHVEQNEFKKLLTACRDDETAAGRRDAALLAILYGAGLRRSEAVRLDAADYDRRTGDIAVRHGKSNKERVVPPVGGVDLVIDEWLRARGGDPGPLLCPVDKHGNVRLRGMTDQAVYKALKKRQEEARLGGFSPHDMRRSLTSELWDAGVDGSFIQQMLGHSSQTITQRYDRRKHNRLRDAVKKVALPDVIRLSA